MVRNDNSIKTMWTNRDHCDICQGAWQSFILKDVDLNYIGFEGQ